jgi:hypothetical protein
MAAKIVDLTPILLLPGVDYGELEILLKQQFANGQQISRNETVHFDRSVEKYSLLIGYKEGLISYIHAGSELSEGKIDSILREINAALLADNGNAIGGKVLFSYYPIEGYFRAGNTFQLRPVPPDAPRPPFSYAEHPGFLEFTFNTSSNRLIRNRRSTQRGLEIGLLLYVLLEGAVSIELSQWPFQWVMLPNETEDTPASYAYCQNGYPNISHDSSQFTADDSWKLLETVEPADYYNRFGIEGRGLQIPNDLEKSVEKYLSLNEENRTKFIRSCFWSHLSSKVISYSRSAAYTALISAVESLIPDAKIEDKCVECGREKKEGPTKQFINFMEVYSPSEGISRRGRSKLYSTRSKLVHGGDLLPADNPQHFLQMFNPNQWDSYFEFREVQQTVKIALYNWLHRQDARIDKASL